MTTGQNKKTFAILALGALALVFAASRFEDPKVGWALISGYILFSLNYMLLAKIYSGLVLIMQNGVTSPAMKNWLLVGSAIKFLGLIAALYALIVLWQLPGLYIALGSLVSLFLLTALLISLYLKSFGSSAPQ